MKNALREEYRKSILDGWEVVEIQLKTETHERLRKELEEEGKASLQRITSFLGILVVIDDTIASDRFFMLRKKRPDEVVEAAK